MLLRSLHVPCVTPQRPHEQDAQRKEEGEREERHEPWRLRVVNVLGRSAEAEGTNQFALQVLLHRPAAGSPPRALQGAPLERLMSSKTWPYVGRPEILPH